MKNLVVQERALILMQKDLTILTMASDVEMRKISELRVVDLKNELERRGLDTLGVKAVLTERLKAVSMTPSCFSENFHCSAQSNQPRLHYVKRV